MYQLIKIEAKYQAALDRLVLQKQSLDRYRAKENHNSKWADDREDTIATLADYLGESKNTINHLAKIAEEEYLRGKIEARREIERAGQNDFRKVMKLSDVLQQISISEDVLRTYVTKENLRKASKEIARLKWPELY